MPKPILLVTIFSVLFNCSLNKKPEFAGIQNPVTLNTNTKMLNVNSPFIFNNPNDLSGTLKADDLKVFIND